MTAEQATRRADRYPRLLPGAPSRCERCGAQIVWAATAARESGRGGKAMPLDLVENFAGNVAVQPGHGARLVARVLKTGETADLPVQFIAMPHFATCPAKGRRR